MSVVFGLSIYKVTASSCTVTNENVLLLFCGGREGGFLIKEGLRVIAEKMKVCSYLHAGNNPYPHDVS
jgi:hypothetical protein